MPIRAWFVAVLCLFSSCSTSNGSEFCTGLSLTLSLYDRHKYSHALSPLSLSSDSGFNDRTVSNHFVLRLSVSLTLSCPVIFPQDVFPVIPGDTDYRMFAEDYGDIPGLDIIFLLGGYYYHTSFDTVDRIVYASFLVYLMVELFLAIL